jgi:hypothetical protein
MSTRSPHFTWRKKKTWCTRLLLALLVADKSLAHVHHHHRHPHDAHHHHHHDISKHHDISPKRDLSASAVQDRTCGAPEPTKEQMIQDKKLAQTWSDLKNQNLEVGGGVRNRNLLQDIVVPVCFHVIRPVQDPADGAIFIDTASLQLQLDALNLAFSPESCCDEATELWCTGECSIETGFRFAMLVLDANGDSTGETTSQVSPSLDASSVCATRSVNEAWYTSEPFSREEESMKRALRRGDARVLNIYFSKPFSSTGDELLGYATFPHDYVKKRYSDGVVVSDTAIAGGSNVAYSEGVSRLKEEK